MHVVCSSCRLWRFAGAIVVSARVRLCVCACEVAGDGRNKKAVASALTQVIQSASAESQCEDQQEQVRKRLRAEAPLSIADFNSNQGVKRGVLLSALKSSQNPYTAAKNRGSFDHKATPEAVEASFKVIFNFLVAAGLAVEVPRAFAIVIKGPPDDKIEEVLLQLKSVLALKEKDMNKVKQMMGVREKNMSFSLEAFKNICEVAGSSMKELE